MPVSTKSLFFHMLGYMDGIKGIIFDKDGTLFDYGEVWGPILFKAISRGLSTAHLSEERRRQCTLDFMKVLGVDDKGNTYPNGIIFRHDRKITATLRILRLCIRYRLSPFMVGRAMFSFMKKTDLGLEERIESMEFPGVREVFEEAYKRGYILGIVTNDTLRSTSLFLQKMGISDYISFIRTKDSPTHPKPNPEAIKEFCEEKGLESQEVAIIGDTIVDMEFAHLGKAGYTVAVLTGSGDVTRLQKQADAVYPTLLDMLSDPVLFP